MELHTYSTWKETEEDAHDYNETKQDSNNASAETAFHSKMLSELIKKYDFFTIRERKSASNKSKKKSKGRKKEKPPNLMDIINSEMGSIVVPISYNVIEIIEDKTNSFRDFIDLFTRDYRTIQRIQSYFNLKHRFQNSQTIYLRRVYPELETSGNSSHDFVAVEYVAPSTFEDLISGYNKGDESCTKFLEVELKDIKFKHHHKYSLESLLSVKLKEQFGEYKNLQQTIEHLSRDVKVMRDTKNNLKRELLKVSPRKQEDLRFDVTVRKYVEQLLELKEKYREMFNKHKAVVNTILSLWSDIEMVREKYESKDTRYDVYIRKYKLSEDELETEWNYLYEEEFSDTIDKLEHEYVCRYIEYRKTKNNYENSPKNKPKMNFDEDELKTEVEQLVNSFILREKLDLSLVRIEGMVNELKNMTNVYHFEVYVDNVFVCSTDYYESDAETLNANLLESFSIEILPENESLTIVLFENYEEAANVEVSLSKVKNVDKELTAVEFKYDNRVDPTTKNVGSDCSIKDIAAANKIRLKSSNLFKGNLVTSCQVLVRLGWSDNTNKMNAITSSVGIGRKLKRLMHGIDKPNIDVLTDLIRMIYIKDIRNDTDMMKTIQRLCKLHVIPDDKFHTHENSTEDTRMRLLHLRNIGAFTNVENKMVPIYGSQISTEQLNCLQNTKNKDINIDYLKSKENDMDPIELQRFIAAKYMQKLNKTVTKSLNEHLMVKTRKDVVREHQNFSFRALFSRQSNVASLSPISSNTKQQILAESLNKEHEIQITVLRAFNLLDRSSGLTDDSENDNDTIAEPVSGFKVRPLRPFVKVSYRGTSAQTGTAMGCHPTWNHTLKIRTKFSPLSNIHINIYDECKEYIPEDADDQTNRTIHYRYCSKWLGMVQMPLYTVLTLGTLRGTFELTTPPLIFGYETSQNKKSTSLIPEVIQLMKKDTSFIALHITSSLSHLGGFQAYNQPLPGTIEDDYIIKHLNTFVTDYVNVFPSRNLTLTSIDSAGRNKCMTQFLQPIPMPSREHFPKNPKGCGSAISKSSGFSRSSSSKSSGRNRDVDVEANEESVYSQGSWKGGDNLGKMINICLRYVALIPTYEVTETHAATLMGLELLKVLLGTPLDHAILLASYFLYIGLRSWVAIGLGLPRGRSSFVIIQYDLASRRYVLTTDQVKSASFLRSDGYLWFVCDATSGSRRELRDAGCPLKTVEYVFDSENIWVNMQTSQDCESVLFDFSKSSDWKPVFDKSIFVMKHPIANETNLYSPPSNAESLRQALEAKIRRKVQKWRPLMKTIWNRYCSSLLRDAFIYWEYWAFNPQESKPGLNQKFKQLLATYKIFGFPLNMPFVNTKHVMAAIKSTGIYISDDPNVEFGLAVEVFVYPNNVLSVWVFFVSICRV